MNGRAEVSRTWRVFRCAGGEMVIVAVRPSGIPCLYDEEDENDEDKSSTLVDQDGNTQQFECKLAG